MKKDKSIFNQFLEYQFPKEQVYLKDNEDYGKNTKKRLMSVSGFSNYLNQFVFDGIPRFALDNAKEFGSQVMNVMSVILANKENIKLLEDVNNYALSQEVADCCKEILHTLSERKFRLKAVDKWVTNGYWKGIVDFIVKNTTFNNRTDTIPMLIEFKTRSSSEAKPSDFLQLSIYKSLIEPFKLTSREDVTIPAEVWVYNKKTKRIKTYKLTYKAYKKNLKLINEVLDTYGLENYKFNLKTQFLTSEELETNYGIKKYNTTFNTRKK